MQGPAGKYQTSDVTTSRLSTAALVMTDRCSKVTREVMASDGSFIPPPALHRDSVTPGDGAVPGQLY